MPVPIIFHSVDSVLQVLEDEKFKHHLGTQTVLKIYNDLLEKSKKLEGNKKHPLIVLEGLDGCGKSRLTRELTKKIGAVLCRTPPKSVSGNLRPLFDEDKVLRNAYYAMGNYVAALEMSDILLEKPVVLDRYWHSTAAYAIGQAAHDCPDEYVIAPKGDIIYNWPSDLLQPDIVLFLSVSENVRVERHSRRNDETKQENLLKVNQEFRESIITAYKNMEAPGLTFINGDPTVDEVLDDIYNRIKHLL